MKNLILVSTITLFSSHAFCQTEKKDAIDIATEKCINSNPSTSGMESCVEEAYTQWDAELNKVYKQLMAVLKPEQKTALQTAQIEWLKYRDLEFKNIANIYNMQGSMYPLMAANARMEFLKTRVLNLRSYYGAATGF